MNPGAYGTSVNAQDALISVVKYAAINLKDAGIDALQLADKLAGAKLQLAASCAVALGWKTPWRHDNPSGWSNSES